MTKTQTISEMLARATRPLISFEFFPPRDNAGLARVEAAIERLEPLHPDYVSVTYGATGSTRDRTFDLTRYIKEKTSFKTMGHLTCVGQTRTELEQAVDSYADVDVSHILAVRGDPEGGPTAKWVPHAGGLSNATELVSLVKGRGDFCVGVAAFPDGHPENRDLDLDARILLDKQEAGAEFAITQLFFSVESYFELVARARGLGCTLPIIAGIMPVTNVNQIQRFAELCGADLPSSVVKPLQAVQDDAAAVRQIGLELATNMCRQLVQGGAPGLQFFTQNRSLATAQILANLQADGTLL